MAVALHCHRKGMLPVKHKEDCTLGQYGADAYALGYVVLEWGYWKYTVRLSTPAFYLHWSSIVTTVSDV